MPKRLRDEPIHVAHELLGYRDEDYNPIVIDERTGVELNPLYIDDKIIIYERQVNEWFLERASSLCDDEINDFLIVMVATSYIEGVEQYLAGKLSNGNSKKVFKKGLNRIFDLAGVSDQQFDFLYSHVRCGFFHNGMSGDAVVLSRGFDHAINFGSRGTIDINPVLFLNCVLDDFKNYIGRLRNSENKELRSNFDKMFEVV